MDDEDSVVRESSLASLQAVLDALSDEAKTGQVLPFLRRACTRLSMDPLDPLAVSFSRALGPLANKLHPLMGEEDYDALVKSFKVGSYDCKDKSGAWTQHEDLTMTHMKHMRQDLAFQSHP